MERVHSKSSILPNMAAKNSTTKPTTPSTTTAERLLAGIMDPFPTWDMNPGMMTTAGSNNASSPPSNNHDIMFNNFMCPIEAPNIFGMSPYPSAVRYTKLSPQSNSSSIGCACGEENAVIRCLDCNEFMCEDCERQHRNSPLSSNHSTISLPTPIGTSPTGSISSCTPSHQSLTNYMCDLHNEMLRYVCEFCKKLVCQCCTLREHKEHNYASIEHFVDDAKDNIDSALESSRMGTRCIKGSIDKALAFIRLTERNCNELSDNIRKGFRQFLITIEDRERFLLDLVEKLRQRRLAVLHEQMAGLKSALSGLSETSDMLHKVAQNTGNMDYIEIAMKVTNGQRQLEQFAAIYKDLQPKQEVFAFAAPDYSLLQDIRNQGTIISVDEKNMPIVNGTAVAGADMGLVMPMPVANSVVPVPLVATNPRRAAVQRESNHRIPSPILPQLGAGATALPNPGLEWELSVRRHSPGLLFGAPRITQAIPGSIEHVRARNSNALTQSFATEGQEDGEVSRPWGVCVDKLGQILVSDRRNNRVQVFKANGTLRFKFGTKGPGNGEFDLPAGICVDIDNRIIVVDKDNHRVQIFTSTGVFLNKFGSYGKEYGQFQYPWDVAVNSRRQIVVTDSRNHRIQQFDSEGRFIRQIVFDNHELNKGIASPRGVCYTPTGNVIVSDFDNHCLYLIDPDKNEILSVKGQEGAGFQEFNRPSGLCCDDDGRIIVADSKNQRVVVFSPSMDYLWDIEIRPSVNPLMPRDLDEKDRTCDVALMPDGRIVFLIELSPDSKEGSNPYKTFVQVY